MRPLHRVIKLPMPSPPSHARLDKLQSGAKMLWQERWRALLKGDPSNIALINDDSSSSSSSYSGYPPPNCESSLRHGYIECS